MKMVRPHRGIALVYAIVVLLVLVGFTSLAVDWGRVQMAKTQLDVAAAASARAAAASLPSGITATQNAAVTWGGYNTCDGSSVVIDPSNDVDFGTWNTGTRSFTVLSGAARSTANAVRINAHRTATRGTAIPLMFGQLIGKSNCDINVSVIASYAGTPMTITGLNSITVHNSAFFASYNSSVTTTPSTSSYNSNAVVDSNGTVGINAQTGGNVTHIYGKVNLGPSGSVNANVSVSGTTTVGSTIASPTMPPFTSVTNPGGVSATPTVSTNTTWQGGTYYFTSLTIQANKTLTFSGAATIYLDGNLTVGGGSPSTPTSIIAYNSIPSNLVIYQNTGDTQTISNQARFVCNWISPGADFAAHDDFELDGGMVAKSITVHDRGNFFADENGSGGIVARVQ